MSTNQLPAGSELDAAVETLVMGRRICSGAPDPGDYRSKCALFNVEHTGNDQVPPYSADTPEGWSLMRAIVARLQELGLETMFLSLEPDGTWEVELLAYSYAKQLRSIIHGGATAPEALSRAALAAVEGQEVDGG